MTVITTSHLFKCTPRLFDFLLCFYHHLFSLISFNISPIVISAFVMSRSGRSAIRSILTAKDLKSFVETYNIPEQFSPSLPGPNEPAECTPDRIPIYTLAFSSCGVRYPLSPFKVALLRHFGVHFSQIHPLGFMRVVQLSCAAVSGEPSIPLFCMFYKLISDGDWFTSAK
ncbi:hypothetical protein Hanom_Chr11g01047641 [Helianthus anomalus]